MSDTYANWLKAAEALIQKAIKDAIEIHKVEIAPEACLSRKEQLHRSAAMGLKKVV